jgi:hypothetical protein
MATTPKSEYVGFTVTETSRVYTLRVCQPDGEFRSFALSIANRAFLMNRVRYQDAPAICFLKLENELQAHGDEKTASSMKVTDAELVEYRDLHEKGASNLRPWPNIKP